MDITLRVNAEYEKASKAFKELASESEETRQKIEKFSQAFQEKNINTFIDKQKLLQVSLTGTRGEVSAMTTAQKNYEKEIERLIKSGLDPESDAIKKLRNEHDNLAKKIKETNEVQKKQDELMKGAEKAALGYFAALAAGATAIGVATQKTAEAGDQFAKTARIIGMTAETFQELNYAAQMSGVDNLESSLEKLNKTVADVKSGTGSLTTYLKENDQQLLNQLQNVNSNEEAFNLLMNAIGKAPDEFSRAELAQTAFGKSGQQLILLANEGAEGIEHLREEARKYGVISNEAAVNSEAFLDAQANLKAALTGVSTELTSGLLPGLTETITKVADFIAGIDNWEEKLSIAGYVLAGVTAGLITFLGVAKGATLVHGLANAFKALTSAIAANPIGAIAVVVTAVLIPALIALYKNWDTVQTYLQQGLARLEYAFKWFGSVIKEGLTVAFNGAKIAAASMLDFIYGNVIRGVGKMLEVLGKLPFVGELFQNASKAVNGLGNAISDMAERTKQQSKAAIQAVHDEQNANEQTLKAKLAAIDSEAEARRAAIEAQKKENQEVVNSNTETNDAIVADTRETQSEIKSIKEKAVKDEIKTLLQRLNEIPHSEQQIQNQQIEQFKRFLAERMGLQFQQQQKSLEAETAYNEQKVGWLQAQLQTLREMQTLDGKERAALEQAVTDMILEIDKDALDKKEKLEKEANKGLSERLSKIPYTEQQIQNQQMEQFQQFLKQRMELEKVDTTNRITWLQEQHESLIKSESVMGEERLALDRAVNAMISEEDERALIERTQSVSDKLKKIQLSEKQIQQQQISQFKQFLEDRMNLEIKVGDNRVTWIQQQQNILLQLQSLTNEEQLALIKASNEMITKERENLNDSLIEKINEVTVIQDELDAREKENIVKQNEAKLELLSQYYDERANLISEKESEHFDFYKAQLELIKENEQFSAEERTAIEEVLQQKISDIQQKMLEERASKVKQVLDISKSFVQGISSLFKIAGKEFKEFAIAEKAISLAEAVINTAVAVSKALASAPFPANLLPAAGAAAAGAAQVATITSTMIPSAETGGRFVVPNSSGVDSQLMRVNHGEEVNITPRGMTGTSGQQRFIFNVEKQTIFDIVNNGLSSGDIYEFSPAWNI
jgi:hypothetical protein